MIPDRNFLEQFDYTAQELDDLERLRKATAALAPERANEVGRKFLQEMWDDELVRLQKTTFITTTKGRPSLLTLNGAQRKFYQDVIVAAREQDKPVRAIICKARQLGFCLHGQTPVLTRDLKWVSVQDLKPGDELVAFDEERPNGRGCRRRLRAGVVEALQTRTSQTVRLSFDDSRTLTCTPEHRWLTRRRGGTDTLWKTAGELGVGDVVRSIVSRRWGDPTPEDSWFGGMLDGEGSLRRKPDGGRELCCSQVAGPVWDRMIRYLDNLGVKYAVSWDHRKAGDSSKLGDKPVGKVSIYRMEDMMLVLGKCRPIRWAAKDDWWNGCSMPGAKCGGIAWKEITAIEDAGQQEVVDIQTSTKTFVANGFASHNSTLIQALHYFWCNEHDYRTAMTISYDEHSSTELFNKSKYIHEMNWFPRPIARKRQRVLEFEEPHRSVFFTLTAGNLSAGRGQTVQHLHMSEVPMWPNPEETVLSVSQTVHPIPHTSIIWESTAKGAQGLFYDEWEAAVEGKGLTPFFAPWYWEPAYTSAFPSDDHRRLFMRHMSEDDKAYMKQYFLTPEQMKWRQNTIRERCQGSVHTFRQEYPACAEEAFLTSGRPAFDPERVMELKANTTPPYWRGEILLEAAQ